VEVAAAAVTASAEVPGQLQVEQVEEEE